jgi:hypothetical protein
MKLNWLRREPGAMKSPMWLLMATIALAPAAMAGTFRVDDSTTFPNDANTAMKWRSLSPSRAGGNVVEGDSVVTVRLNLAPWLNKNGRIYMALSEQPIGQVKAAWVTQGRLLPGELISGNRTLVYAGPIRTALLEDTIALKFEADGRRLVSPQRLHFYFEIDVD